MTPDAETSHFRRFHPQEAKPLVPGKVLAKKIPKPLEKAPEPVPEPEPEPEPEPVKEEKLSPEPILVNLLCLSPSSPLDVSFPHFIIHGIALEQVVILVTFIEYLAGGSPRFALLSAFNWHNPHMDSLTCVITSTFYTSLMA